MQDRYLLVPPNNRNGDYNMAQIEHSDMVRVLAKSGSAIADEMTQTNAHLLHMAIGISGEAAELLSAYVTSTELRIDPDHENVVEELGDLEFYIEGFRQGLSVTRVDAHKLYATPFDSQYTKQREWLSVKLSVASGDLLDMVKKFTIYQKPLPVNDTIKQIVLIDNILECIRECEGLTYQQVLDANITKLGKRYEGFKYTDQAAQTRADKVT